MFVPGKRADGPPLAATADGRNRGEPITGQLGEERANRLAHLGHIHYHGHAPLLQGLPARLNRQL